MQALCLAREGAVGNYFAKRLIKVELVDGRLHVFGQADLMASPATKINCWIGPDGFESAARVTAHELVMQRQRGADCWAFFAKRANGKLEEVLAVDYDAKVDASFCCVQGRSNTLLPPQLGRRVGALMERAATMWELPVVDVLGRDTYFYN